MLSSNPPDLEQRSKDFKLVVASRAEQAVEDADAVIIASRKPGALANERFMQIALERAPSGGACFVHGALANSLERGREFADLAHSRQIALLAGTPLCVTWRLPEAGTATRHAPLRGTDRSAGEPIAQPGVAAGSTIRPAGRRIARARRIAARD